MILIVICLAKTNTSTLFFIKKKKEPNRANEGVAVGKTLECRIGYYLLDFLAA